MSTTRSINSVTNQTYIRKMDEIQMDNRSDFSINIENEDEPWRKTWNLYLSMAQNPKINDAKRQILLQLAEDAKEQHANTIKQAKILQKESSQIIDLTSKRKSKISKIISNPNFKLFLIILRWFAIISVISIIFVTFFIFYRFNSDNDQSKNEDILHFQRGIVTEISEETNFSPNDGIVTKSYTEASSTSINRPTIIKYYRITVFLIVPVCFLLFVLCCIISNCVIIRIIITRVFYRPCQLYRTSSVLSEDRALSLIHRIEKIVLLDPMIQHLRLQTLSEGSLLIYTSIDDCFHELTSNRLNDYTLFLSLATFEVRSLELSRLSNISLGIFYEDNDQSHPQISKRKYHIRFIFPRASLLDYLRHTIILNYTKQGHMYHLQGLEREADECFLAAREHCCNLADDLEQQSSAIRGREPQESPSNVTETMDDLVLQSSAFILRH